MSRLAIYWSNEYPRVSVAVFQRITGWSVCSQLYHFMGYIIMIHVSPKPVYMKDFFHRLVISYPTSQYFPIIINAQQ